MLRAHRCLWDAVDRWHSVGRYDVDMGRTTTQFVFDGQNYLLDTNTPGVVQADSGDSAVLAKSTMHQPKKLEFEHSRRWIVWSCLVVITLPIVGRACHVLNVGRGFLGLLYYFMILWVTLAPLIGLIVVRIARSRVERVFGYGVIVGWVAICGGIGLVEYLQL